MNAAVPNVALPEAASGYPSSHQQRSHTEKATKQRNQHQPVVEQAPFVRLHQLIEPREAGRGVFAVGQHGVERLQELRCIASEAGEVHGGAVDRVEIDILACCSSRAQGGDEASGLAGVCGGFRQMLDQGTEIAGG